MIWNGLSSRFFGPFLENRLKETLQLYRHVRPGWQSRVDPGRAPELTA